MGKKLWGFGLAFGTVGLLAITGYSMERGRFKTATKAELAKVVNPELLVPILSNPEALGRFARLEKLIEEAKPKRFDEATEEERRRLVAELEPTLRKIDALLSEGPIHRPKPDGNAPVNFFTLQKDLFKAIQYGARAEMEAGNHQKAASLCRFGSRLLDALRPSASTLIEYLVDTACVAILYKGVSDAIPELRESELADLALMFPPAPLTDEYMRNAMRGEFQQYAWNILPNPVEGLKAVGYTEEVEEGTSDFDFSGNYDPYETTRMMSDLYAEARASALLPRAATGPGSGALPTFEKAQKLVSTLPSSSAAGKSGIERRLAKFRYGWEMGRVPNSFGLRLMDMFGPVIGDSLMASSYRARTNHEGVRALIAIRRYELKHRRLPASLKSLIDEGYLASMPLDHLSYAKGDKPGVPAALRYVSSRKLLWSAGTDGKDDGGVSSTKPYEPDYVWALK